MHIRSIPSNKTSIFISYLFGTDFVCPFQVLPALCVWVAAACVASVTSEKNTPLEFWSLYLVDFVIF